MLEVFAPFKWEALVQRWPDLLAAFGTTVGISALALLMALALGIAHSQQAAQAQREVTDMTNELLRKNAAALKMATVETAKESERGIVDMETLRETNNSLISTLDEVLQIQEEGRRKRAEAETELAQIENQLKQKLLDIRR